MALSNGKSHAASEYSRHESAVEFLKDVEEQLEVANVQLEIHREVRSLMARSGELSPFENLLGDNWGGLDRLESNLLTISEVCTSSLAVPINLTLLYFQLYREYADPLNMPRMKLLVFHVAAYNDAPLVRRTWDTIIDDSEPLLISCASKLD